MSFDNSTQHPEQFTGFFDKRVFAVAPNDARLAVVDQNPVDVAVRYEQDLSGPTYLVIGPAADDDALARASSQFNISLPGLVSLRDMQIGAESVTVGYFYACNDERRQGGGTVFSVPLSPLFDAPQKAEAALEKIKNEHQEAYICESFRFFNNARPGDSKRLTELISKIR